MSLRSTQYTQEIEFVIIFIKKHGTSFLKTTTVSHGTFLYKSVVCSNNSVLHGTRENILQISSAYWSRFASYEQHCPSSGLNRAVGGVFSTSAVFRYHWFIKRRREMKNFIVLCFSLCLVKGSKGMSCFAYDASNSGWLKCRVMQYREVSKIESVTFLSNGLRQLKFRHSASFVKRSDFKSIHYYFVISNAFNDD